MKRILDPYKGYELVKNHITGDYWDIAEVTNTNFPVYFLYLLLLRMQKKI